MQSTKSLVEVNVVTQTNLSRGCNTLKTIVRQLILDSESIINIISK